MPLHSVDSSLNTPTEFYSSNPILPLPSPNPPQSIHSTPKIQKSEEILDQDFLTQGRTLPRASCRQIMGLGMLQIQMCKEAGIFSMTICFKTAQLQSVPIEQERVRDFRANRTSLLGLGCMNCLQSKGCHREETSLSWPLPRRKIPVQRWNQQQAY